ncbi:MAG: type II secretion system secretin GspD [Acetobacteraceae bacterium]|nr:type II secretion system secretin GspD [Acetobacteraceae bacterium]
MIRHTPVLLLALALFGCERAETPALQALPIPRGEGGTAVARVNGPVGATTALGTPLVTYGVVRPSPNAVSEAASPYGPPAAGDVSLDFVDTDVREIVAQVLGTILRVNYTIDPSVRGTATLRTVNPIPRSRVLAALQTVLAQNGATILEAGGLYRVTPAAGAAAAPGLATPGVAGSAVIPLRYASAEDLAKVLQPYAGATGRVAPDPGRNALLISGDPGTREALLNLVHAFDIDALAGQSYALFPVGSGTARDFGTAMTEAMRSGQGGSLASVVRVVPMERINAVLLISAQPRYVDEARRIYALVERNRRQTVRGWSVFYLQNSKSNDVAYVLQQAFTPNHVTATPSARAIGASARRSGGTNSFNSGGGAGGGLGGAGVGLRGGGGAGGLSGPASVVGGQDTVPSQLAPGQNPANPLLGGLDPVGGAGGGPAGGGDADLNSIRIIPNAENNALLVYATPAEHDTIEAMLHKIDILPLQVRIDAVIAEVTLNDNLSYGTQFFFKNGGINGALNFNTAAGAAASALASTFPGFVLTGGTNETYALNALQNVTTVKVLSSPQLMVLDNESARLQVGNLVPYLTTSSQSTISANSAIINSIDYRETGVIMEVTPRVNSGGLVTLDIAQEVSDVDTAATTTSQIASPTFLERNVRSRVVVQDGQTIGLAGLIRDNSSRSNGGIPWLKDIPLLGLLAGQQSNNRGRTELLVLVTPHVVHDQRDARALTEDLRDQLINAAAIPSELQRLPPSGSPDPQRPLRRAVGLTR